MFLDLVDPSHLTNASVCPRGSLTLGLFNIDSLGFLVVSMEVDWISLAFLDMTVLYCLLCWKTKSWLWHSKRFPICLSQEVVHCTFMSGGSSLSQVGEAPDWQLPVKFPDWRWWSDRHQERLCLKPSRSNKETCPPFNNLFSVQLVLPLHGSDGYPVWVLPSAPLLVNFFPSPEGNRVSSLLYSFQGICVLKQLHMLFLHGSI